MSRQGGARSLALALALGAGVSPISGWALKLSAPVRVGEGTAAFRVSLDLEAPLLCPPDAIEVLESTAVLRAEQLAFDTECGLARAGEDFRSFEIRVPLGGSRTRIQHRLAGLLIDDQVFEPCEAFELRVDRIEPDPGGSAEIRCKSSGESVQIRSGDTARVVIVDDDDTSSGTPSIPEISITGDSVIEGDSGIRQAVFRVGLTAPSSETVRVSWTTADESASFKDDDYEPAIGSLTWGAQDNEDQTILVSVFGDRRCEDDESFQVQLILPDGRIRTARATVLNDDGLKLEAFGDGQTGAPGEELTVEVKVTDKVGAREGAMVTWGVTSQSARFTATDSETNSDGLARAIVELGDKRVTVTATVEDESCSGSVTFQLITQGPPGPDTIDEVPLQGTVAIEGIRVVHRALEERMKSARGPTKGSSRALGGFGGSSSSSGSRPESANESGFDFDLESLAAGLDAELKGGFLVGGALAYTEGDARIPGRVGGLDSRAWSASLYAACQPTLELHLEGILSWGRVHFATEREVGEPGSDSQVARAKPDGTIWALSLGGGSGGDFGALHVEGFGYLHWSEVEIDRYTETGAGDSDLEVFEQRQNSLLAEAGFELLYRIAHERWGLGLHFASSFLHELEDDARPITARFLNRPELVTHHLTDPPDRDYLNLEAGATAKLPGPWSAYLSFSKEVNRDDLETQSLLLGVLLQF